MAANLFKIDQKYLTVGNGASELICALGESLPKSKIGYFNPSFDEYASRFSAHEFEFVDAFNLNNDQVFSEIRNLSIKCDFVILVNPDNPTGRFIDPLRILELLPALKANSCTLILDESFVDFSTLFEAGTLISDQVLLQNENLVIVKSISKSYGVAGIRLGVIATGNEALLNEIRKKLPVWNINSFAEKFLQKITYFQNEYWASCRKLADERSKFSRKLEICNVKVWESAANFLMIELPENIDLNRFCNYMIKNEILVKSLVGKKGIPDGNFLRIAIKSESENNLFLDALRRYEASFT
jgi:histidinol-phosphate/aromatic aminotransferase/cobyric acid decarboxylase-like protein